jgi:hypothetical protein
MRRSHWTRGLRHEMSSPSETLGPWVGIPFELWTSVRASSVFVLSFVGSGLATELIPVQGALPTVCNIHNSIIILMGTDQRTKYETEKMKFVMQCGGY